MFHHFKVHFLFYCIFILRTIQLKYIKQIEIKASNFNRLKQSYVKRNYLIENSCASLYVYISAMTSESSDLVSFTQHKNQLRQQILSRLSCLRNLNQTIFCYFSHPRIKTWSIKAKHFTTTFSHSNWIFLQILLARDFVTHKGFYKSIHQVRFCYTFNLCKKVFVF